MRIGDRSMLAIDIRQRVEQHGFYGRSEPREPENETRRRQAPVAYCCDSPNPAHTARHGTARRGHGTARMQRAH